ncbi:hypothetical protein GCM10009809_23450 [Isoptericola hypogeus]|uniref:Glycosyl hydrolases family 43 n=1 Tax=Isoptericola hypogeus TaxID=300179 RepID=A0ABP4VHP0_9MICO
MTAAALAASVLTAHAAPAPARSPAQPHAQQVADSPGAAWAADAADEAPATYSNPVSAGVVDTFPDPTVIRGKDGAWYAYGTQNPIFNSAGEAGEHILPILRSTDLVDWEYVGDVIETDAVPATWRDSSRAWAPDVRYVAGEYHLTYGLSTGGLALATAPTPTGPWTHHDELLVPSAPIAGCPTGNIDQALFSDDDGTLYLYWGSYDVVCVSELTPDGTELTGRVTPVAQGRRMEGAFVVHRGDAYYLMYSEAGCCEGESSGYTVKVGRGESPRGPFVDDEGTDLMAASSKAGFVLAANGNRFAGPGHHTVVTDLAGQDWMVYHAIPRDDADFPPVATRNGTLNLSKRPMMVDRLDWIDGWPVVNAGAGPSEGEQAAPVTSGVVTSTLDDLRGWRAHGPVRTADDSDAGGHARLGDGASLASTARGRGDLRAQADLRVGDGGAAGLTLGATGNGGGATAWIDRDAGELRLEARRGARTVRDAVRLPDGFRYADWHVVTLDRRGARVTAAVSADNVLDPLGAVTVDAPRGAGGGDRVGVLARGGDAEADNVSLVPLAEPVTERVPDPEPGELLAGYSDEFDGDAVPGEPGSGWSWVRGPAAGVGLQDGAFAFPTQAAELAGGTNTASVLRRAAPEGDYLVETRMTLGGHQVNQQAGLVLYGGDDRFVKLVHSHLGLQRKPGLVAEQVEFTREGPRPTATPPAAAYASPMWGAAPAETTWLRLLVHRDVEHGEHDVRMASSTDGESWQWGGTWTLPADGDLDLGLVAMNTAGAAAGFDYVRTYAVD